MKQFARFVSFSAILIFSGVSLNTQAIGLEDASFKSNIELQLTRSKAEALVSMKYEVKQLLKQPKALFLGSVVASDTTETNLKQYSDNVVLNNLENLAD